MPTALINGKNDVGFYSEDESTQQATVDKSTTAPAILAPFWQGVDYSRPSLRTTKTQLQFRVPMVTE